MCRSRPSAGPPTPPPGGRRSLTGADEKIIQIMLCHYEQKQERAGEREAGDRRERDPLLFPWLLHSLRRQGDLPEALDARAGPVTYCDGTAHRAK